LSPGVYWFRRLLVVLLVLALLVGLWWLFGSRGGGDDPAAVSATATPTPTPTTESPSPSPTPTSTSPEPTKKSSPSPSTTKAPDCRNKDLAVTVSTDAESYPPGAEPLFTLTVTNESDTTCRRDVGQRALELRVSSRGSRVWSSDDCNPGGGRAVTEFQPRQSVTQSLQWDRRTSQPGCPSGEPEADPGTYQVLVRNLDLLSEPASFTLQG
jgi:cytoskeletal protein RodZ